MKKIKALVSVLLALALIGACGLAFAEGGKDLYFTPGEDLVLLDQDGVKITLKGDQPKELTDRYLQLGVLLENNTDKIIQVKSRTKINGEIALMGLTEEDLVLQGVWYGLGYMDDILMGESIETYLQYNIVDYAKASDNPAEILAKMKTFDGLETSDVCFFIDDGTEEKEMEPITIHFKPEGEEPKVEIEETESDVPTYETLDVGSKGDAVKALQEKLIALGYLDGGADGIYGKGTAGAVQKFQAAEGLPETGTADSATQEKLFSK